VATLKVTCRIALPAEGVPPKADVGVFVEDVSRADAPAVVLAEHHARKVALSPGGVLTVDVEVPGDAVDPRRSYAVRAHLAASRSGEIEKGDLVSTQHHPVLTQGHGREVRVPVKRV
jgi:putative lipoprotein